MKQGYEFASKPIPEIPKRITEASIRRLERLTTGVLRRRTRKGQAEYRKQRREEAKKVQKALPKEVKPRDAYYRSKPKKKGTGTPPKITDKVMEYLNDVTQRWDGFKYENYVRMTSTIADWTPQRGWSDDYMAHKEALRSTLSRLIDGAVKSEGLETVMRRLEEVDGLDDLVGYVLYGSDDDKVQQNLSRLAAIMYGRPLTVGEAKAISAMQEGQTSYTEEDEY